MSIAAAAAKAKAKVPPINLTSLTTDSHRVPACLRGTIDRESFVHILLVRIKSNMGQSSSKESTPQEVQEVSGDRTGGSDAPLQSTSTAAEAQPPKQRQPNKVREGPCAQIFEDLDKCAAEKGVTKHAVRFTTECATCGNAGTFTKSLCDCIDC